MDISGRHFLITGSGKRLGRALAESFLAKGAKVSAHYRTSQKDVEALAAAFPGKVFPLRFDLAAVAELPGAVKNAEAHFGPLDCLINCASNFYPTPLLDCTEAQWDDLQNGNVKGQFFLSQAVARSMKGRGGLILNLADVNGERPMRNFAPYVTAKAGLLMLTRVLALELAPHVRVNSISPGAVLLPEHYTDAQRDKAIERTLLKRLGGAEDIVAAAHFLVENDYLTGIDLKVDGGRSLI